MKEASKSKAQVSKKRKDIKLLVIYSEIPHTQVPHHVTTSQLNFDKSQINGLRKTRDNRTKNLRTDSSKNANKSEIK